MSEENEVTVRVEFPEGSWKPIPHYHEVRSLATDLVALFRALPHFGAVVEDVYEQANANEEDAYADAIDILLSCKDAYDELRAGTEKLDPLVEELGDAMHNWGPVRTTIFFLIQAYPDQAGEAIADLVRQAVRQGTEEV